MITACIFDFDGTIIDTESSQYSTVRDEFARHGVEYDLELFRQGVGRADHKQWFDVLQDLIGPRDDIDEIFERRKAAHRAEVAEAAVRPGVFEVIEWCEANEVALALASSSPMEWVELNLGQRDMVRRFGFLSTRDQVAHAKPWPDVYQLAAQQLAVDPAECLAIEDSVNGLRAAKAAGMTCVVVPNMITAPSDFSEADYVFDSLIELIAILPELTVG